MSKNIETVKEPRKRKTFFKILGRSYSKGDTIVGWAFLLPATVLGIIFVLTPMIISLSYAFTDANLLRLNNIKINGIDNFKRIFNDEMALTAFLNTLEFVVKVVPLQLGLALILALFLNSQKRGSTFLRWAFFSPVMLSLAVTSLLWMNLFNVQDGLFNALLQAVGLPRQNFLTDSKQALNIIVFISAWQGAGYQMLILLSALKNIPAEIYEAASIDGATPARKFFFITLPLVKPTFSFVLITMLIGAFRLIVQPMIMTGGGPVDSTLTVSFYIYKQGINYRDVGYSSAIAMVYTVIIATVALTLRRVFKEEAN